MVTGIQPNLESCRPLEYTPCCVGKIPPRRLDKRGFTNYHYFIREFNEKETIFTILPTVTLNFQEMRHLCEDRGFAKLPVPKTEEGY